MTTDICQLSTEENVLLKILNRVEIDEPLFQEGLEVFFVFLRQSLLQLQDCLFPENVSVESK